MPDEWKNKWRWVAAALPLAAAAYTLVPQLLPVIVRVDPKGGPVPVVVVPATPSVNSASYSAPETAVATPPKPVAAPPPASIPPSTSRDETDPLLPLDQVRGVHFEAPAGWIKEPTTIGVMFTPPGLIVGRQSERRHLAFISVDVSEPLSPSGESFAGEVIPAIMAQEQNVTAQSTPIRVPVAQREVEAYAVEWMNQMGSSTIEKYSVYFLGPGRLNTKKIASVTLVAANEDLYNRYKPDLLRLAKAVRFAF